MDAYKFLNWTPRPSYRQKALKYDFDDLANTILTKNDPGLIRSTIEYKEAESAYFDAISSCDRAECIHWLDHYMINAVAFGLQTADRLWIAQFLAAYDLLPK